MDDNSNQPVADETVDTGAAETAAPTRPAARDLTADEGSLLFAIAETNGHPSPADYVAEVAAKLKGPQA